MKQKSLILLLLVLFAATVFAQNNTSHPFEIKIQKIGEGVYVAYRPNAIRVPVEGNVTIIINDRDVVVVDGSGAPYAARRVIEEIKKLTANPVRYLVNTHGHGDHTVGNQEYVRTFPGVEIVARPETRAYMAGSGLQYVSDIAENPESRRQEDRELIAKLKQDGAPGYEKVVAFWRQYYEHDLEIRSQEYRGVEIFPPTMSIDKGITLYRGARTIEIMFLGHGKTASDVVVYLPNEKILVAGDIITEPIPYGFSRRPVEWLATMEKVQDMDFDVLVPGHGEVQRGKANLNAVIGLTRHVLTRMQAAIAQGLDLESARKQIDMNAFENRFTKNDPVLRDLWQRWFWQPCSERVFDELMESKKSR